MEAALIVFVVIWIGTGYGGVKLIQVATRRRAEPAIPPARVANAEGADYAYQKSADLAKRGSRKIGKGLGVSIGLFLIAWPIVLIIWFLTVDWGFDMKMGRKLRIRGREVLPPTTHGDGWTPARASVSAPARARDAIAAYWLLAARTEHASVPAFSQVALQLAALGAPARLLRATHEAALDEIRHAETCFAIARALGATDVDVGPITALASPGRATVTLERLAVESLVDGCLAEGIAADVAALGAQLATEPAIRDALGMIARDEENHAELAWTVVAWCLEQRPDLSRALAATHLDASAPDVPSGDETTFARYGIVGARDTTRLAVTRCDAVRARLDAMVDASLARAA
jgi:hypothetical protein